MMNRRDLTLRTLAALSLSGWTSAALAAPLEIAGEPKMLAVGSVKGLQMLIEGRVKVAALSDTLEDAVAALKKAGTSSVPGNLKFSAVISEKLVPMVHPSNPVKALSRDQLRDLFSGKVKNWKEVGGPDAPVALVVASANSGTRGVFDRAILGTLKAAPTAKEVRTASAEVAEVARNANAIGMVGEGTVASGDGKVKAVDGPDVSRTLGFVTQGDPTGDVAKLIAWWRTPEAQKLFAK